MIVSPPTVSEITCGLFTRYLTGRPPWFFALSLPSLEHLNQESVLNQPLISQEQP